MIPKMALTFEEWKGETRLVQQNFSDMLGTAIPVVEFSREGYRIRKVLG